MQGFFISIYLQNQLKDILHNQAGDAKNAGNKGGEGVDGKVKMQKCPKII